MANCKICLKLIKSQALKLKCSDCGGDFHAACFKYSKADVENVTAEGLAWRCTECAAVRRKSMRFETAASDGKLTLEDVMKVITEIRDSQRN